ncbi:MAG: double-strand break repair helicase AddA [Aestuariivita sp.]|nr:double-strand break repair helicase AddA [Aestuariivita sp.]
MNPDHPATIAQVTASNPKNSTWLSANAGSGKTKVLTDRVARLLLLGVQPQKILCITFTKAAASEMQNRLFDRLGEWAMLPDQKLRKMLRDLGVEKELDQKELRVARTLFARAIETPGGLKIQTVHSFCAGLLRRFPLEAKVSLQFSEIDDRSSLLLRSEVIAKIADGEHQHLIANLLRHPNGSNLDRFAAAATDYRESFTDNIYPPELFALFGLPHDISEEKICAQVFLPDVQDILNTVTEALAKSEGPTDRKMAAHLLEVSSLDYAALPKLEHIFLTGSGAQEPFSPKIDKIPSKRAKVDYRINAQANLLMTRLAEARPQRLNFELAIKTIDLHNFARVFIAEYEQHKLIRGWLDFDDLISRSLRLLSDPAVAQWVLYRLDGGIDHILVDEAQDTSPIQWSVIKKLSQEFFSSELHDSPNHRSIFVVGDKKQSIYSFQGADPSGFDLLKQHYSDQLATAGQELQECNLEYSFRSAPAILHTVDNLFLDCESAGFDDATHLAFNDWLPGRVDLWPVVPSLGTDADAPWYEPVDQLSEKHHAVVLADSIASQLRRLIELKTPIPAGSGFKPITAGDILILVQRRSMLFAEIIRACKLYDLPIAGTDRLKVVSELAVRDLIALLSFLVTPEDDLSLATALRSPLFGWSEQDLFSVAHKRPEKTLLWQALRHQSENFPKTVAILHDLRDHTEFCKPYELLERILTRHRGRHHFLSRLGREAEEGINALLAQALGYERLGIPSLSGFLSWLETDMLEVKRQIDDAGDMIRVMTVHGAKGLEAPVVILPDTADDQRGAAKGPVLLHRDIPIWRVSKDVAPAEVLTTLHEEQQFEEQERLRLFYVAATRAEKWLIVAAAGDRVKENSWYQRLESVLHDYGGCDHEFELGTGLRLENGKWSELSATASSQPTTAFPPLPSLYTCSAPPAPPSKKVISPSDLGGAKALGSDANIDQELAMIRGTHLHLLLEVLPPLPRDEWLDTAYELLDLAQEDAEPIISEAIAVLENPEVKQLFNSPALTEVPISADWGEVRLYGIIDRLIFLPDHLLAVDFKTNTLVPETVDDVPEGLLRQMAAYEHALTEVYPGRRVETAILWTRTACLMSLPSELVREAGNRVEISA